MIPPQESSKNYLLTGYGWLPFYLIYTDRPENYSTAEQNYCTPQNYATEQKLLRQPTLFAVISQGNGDVDDDYHKNRNKNETLLLLLWLHHTVLQTRTTAVPYLLGRQLYSSRAQSRPA